MNLIANNFSNNHEVETLIHNLNIIVENLNADATSINERKLVRARIVALKDEINVANAIIADALSVCENLNEELTTLRGLSPSSRITKIAIRETEKKQSRYLERYYAAQKALSSALSSLSACSRELAALEEAEARYRFNVHNLYNPYIAKLNKAIGTEFPTINEKGTYTYLLSTFAFEEPNEDSNQQ